MYFFNNVTIYFYLVMEPKTKYFLQNLFPSNWMSKVVQHFDQGILNKWRQTFRNYKLKEKSFVVNKVHNCCPCYLPIHEHSGDNPIKES